ncbi:hypothetical protein [Umezakia ovalisporum]|uniref:P pilus assembly/Cpx signaling pathway, periplasmic inhibitor/zinc-resistance associated protein n=4 Tax=Umezakia ovalisporum TaxID=75695 RepID=A0AA43KF83_9CYAN|nr:hypothetical protein [Umezakia ovalisporum]MBI1240038.1 hypothetical protein [Nostoc sp. RI_552]MDH6056950.1 hypothetical protein [Umezakia ovalisporum FSS-43]MDH6064484.1 hypothetical protein [Umezakia ovalisporum FSS-62]MDH6068400.1 hypothetical protein [Umezakia ovalisporum APH033B]MDH6074834.1 hypothetical protein [Umezakia ovalisporum CS-1034]MDH6101140.1 hypothetical protein [Umezakia ovalisporum ANA283AFssAo]
MAIKLIKHLSVFANILAFVILIPGIALAAPVQINPIPRIIISQFSNTNAESSLFSDTNLTPQQQQQLQAVRQRRNKEISAVLNSSQRAKLAENMRSGNDINQGLEKLNLPPEQKDLINAIIQWTNLKIQATSSRHSLQRGQE